MHEPNELTPDPLVVRLARFTPDASAIDRDALLFRAGRASVKPSRWWPVLVGLLGISQIVTLVVLLPRTERRVEGGSEPARAEPVIPPEPIPVPSTASPADANLWTLQHRWLEGGEAPPLPQETEDTFVLPPPRTAFAVRADLWNLTTDD